MCADYVHKHVVRKVRFNPSGTKLATGGQEKLLRLYDCRAGNDQPLLTSSPFEGSIHSIFWTSDDVVHACCDNGDTYALDCRVGPASVSKVEGVRDVKFAERILNSPNTIVASSSSVSILDARVNQLRHIALPNVSVGKIFCACLHPTQPDILCVGGEDTCISIIDMSDSSEIATWRGHHGPIHACSFSPDAGHLATGSEDGTIRLWDYESERAKDKEHSDA
jgi:serine-threonine kinase receptor-associated protein